MIPLHMTIGKTFSPHASALLADSWWSRLWFQGRTGDSSFAGSVDAVFFYIFWVSVFFFVLLMALTVIFAIKYRRQPGKAPEVSPAHNTLLELSWSVIPLILMVVMFVWGFQVYIHMRVAPAGAEEIFVTAKQWNWDLQYKNGATSIETEKIADKEQPVFAFPANRPVKLVLNSEDVIHSFYIPAFRTKIDVFPNRYTTLWMEPRKATHTMVKNAEDKWETMPINPDDPGYYLFCTEYCGDYHSQMSNRIIVLEEEDFQLWLKNQLDTSGIPLLELGATLYNTKGCATCHSVDGSRKTGPTWQGVWNQDRPGYSAPEGAEPIVDFNYVRQSVLEPGAYLVSGYANQMPTYQGRLTEREIRALATYIQSLTPEFAEQAAAQSQQELENQDSGGEGAMQ